MSSYLNRTVLMLAASMALGGLAAPSAAQEALRSDATPVRLALLQASGDTYTVQRGDTLFGISRRLGVPADAIAEANGLGAEARIDAGMRLRIPGSGEAAGGDAGMQAAGRIISVTGGASTYVVRSGDTVDGIAARLGMTRREFADLNGLKPPYALSVGRSLKGPPETRRVYVVAAGDSLEAVARRLSVTTRQLASANGLRSTASLRAGQRLTLPQGYRDRGPVRATTTVARPSAPPADTARAPRGEPEIRADAATETGSTTVRVLAGGRVVSVRGEAVTYTVRSGDTVDEIAARLGLSRRELANLNGLEPPYPLRPGQVLKGPSRTERAYVVVGGDTLSVVARRFGVTPRALAAANNLRTTASLRAGQRLILPDGFRDRGPIRETVRTPPPARPPAPQPEAIAPETDAPLEDPSATAPPELRPAPGQAPVPRPATPSAPPSPPPAAPPAPPAPPTAATEPPARPVVSPPPPPPPRSEPPRSVPPRTEVRPPPPAPARPVQPAAPQPRPQSGGFTPPPTASTTALTDSQITALGKGRFLWPLRGEILSDFGPKGTGQRNDGINIRAPRGAPVRASAAGEVVYAGDQVPGFGNLVLIKHPDGWVTAYAHLSNVDVRIQQKVLQGQQIGEAGDTGGVPEPQLHFEIRYAPTPTERARPVSPTLLLPR